MTRSGLSSKNKIPMKTTTSTANAEQQILHCFRGDLQGHDFGLYVAPG